MLTLMRIRNYAIVEEVEVDFSPGFSVMTGETGAGKSILVDAMGLALGDRADSSAVRHGADKAEISVLFDSPADHPASEWLAAHGLDGDDGCSLRRIVSSEGRSRAFINNQPVTLQDLRELGSMLIEIHGQHEHQTLLTSGEQRRLLDASAGLLELAADVARAYAESQHAKTQLEQRRADSADREAQIELLKFQLAELRELGLAEGEIESLLAEHHRLAHIDETQAAVQAALERAYGSDEASAHSLIADVLRALDDIRSAEPEIRDVIVQLGSIQIELNDAATTLKRYGERLEADPERLAWLDTRLARARSLARRHKVDDAELFRKHAELEAALAVLESADESLESLARRAAEAEQVFAALAGKLSKARRKHARRLEQHVSEQLKNLGLPDGSCSIAIEAKASADAHGVDHVEFRVTMNPGQPPAPLARVASGGELSRLSLAIQLVAARVSPVTTLVFDEVDSGIGGAVAETVGRSLKRLGKDRQVLCVTHLPQVAAQGDEQWTVVRASARGRIGVDALRLDRAGRIEELARMLGGAEITATTRKHAAELLDAG